MNDKDIDLIYKIVGINRKYKNDINKKRIEVINLLADVENLIFFVDMVLDVLKDFEVQKSKIIEH